MSVRLDNIKDQFNYIKKQGFSCIACPGKTRFTIFALGFAVCDECGLMYSIIALYDRYKKKEEDDDKNN